MKVYNKTIPEIKLKAKNGSLRKVKFTKSEDCYKYFLEIFDEESLEVYEQVMVLFLNNANETVGWYKASQGGISKTVIDVRLILKAALDCYATAMIICHNHPSGRLIPSDADNKITDKLKRASDLIDIKLLDHLIITTYGFYSYQDECKL